MTPIRSVVIHGHFYQPPREDPWLDEIPTQPSAAPYHDWNDRIEHECYRAVTAARVPTGDGKIARIVNTLAGISFDFGPTLLDWLERAAPETYAAVIEADRVMVEATGGHGNAIAMPYHHAILPLATRRDKVTEVRWGMADFRRRFGREPVGMWLPETAVDAETLGVLAQEGIAFTVLAPHQVRGAPASGEAGRFRTGGDRSIALFVYDGALSHGVGFGPLLKDAAEWERQLTTGARSKLTAVATDGETYGHHHAFGEMALAALIEALDRRPHVQMESFDAFLARHPARKTVELVASTSWSCSHGVERWRADCGCKMHPERTTQQAWRRTLRETLDWLAGELHRRYEHEGSGIFRDPWGTRDEYGAAVVEGPRATTSFVRTHARSEDAAMRRRGAELLEMERNALRMFTSCGWFFDDIAGLESRQVLAYAARAIELSGPDAPRLDEEVRRRLAAARSNDPGAGTGRDLYDAVRPKHPAPVLAAGACAAVAHLALRPEDACVRGYTARPTGDGFVVTSTRTGANATFRTEVHGARPGTLTVRVTSDDGTATLGVTDLPDRARHAVAHALRRAIVERHFDAAHRDRLLAGSPRAAVAESVLMGAIQGLAESTDEEAPSRVLDLLDLFDLLALPFPFDAQSAFYRLWRDADAARGTALSEVARRLGFA